MSAKSSFNYKPFVLAAGLAMALGPLTALSVSSVLNGTAGQPVVAGNADPLPSYDTTRMSTTEYSGKMLADIAAGSGSLDFFSSVLQASQVNDTQTALVGDAEDRVVE